MPVLTVKVFLQRGSLWEGNTLYFFLIFLGEYVFVRDEGGEGNVRPGKE